MSFVSGIYLAAGLSSRMGRGKLLLRLPEGPLFEYSLKSAAFSDVDELIVVLGRDRGTEEAVRDFLEKNPPKMDLRIVNNPHPERGMAGSVRLGVGKSNPRAEGFLFLLADLPFVSRETVNRVLEVFREDPRGNAVPFYGGKQGHPVIISGRWRRTLENLSGDSGGRGILKEHPEDIRRVDFISSLPLFDIDTEEDFTRAAELHEIRFREDLKNIVSSGLRPCLALAGGGGKTSFMTFCAALLKEEGKRVLMTTTTKLESPSVRDYGADRYILSSGSGGKEAGSLEDSAATEDVVLWLGAPEPGREKYGGPSIEKIRSVYEENTFDLILIEADGSAGRPLKVPGENEPVIPDFINAYVAVVGMDALGKPADRNTVHRMEKFRSLFGEKPLTITEETIIRLAEYPEGLFKNAPAHARRILVCNRCDHLSAESLKRVKENFRSKVKRADLILFTRMLPQPEILGMSAGAR